MRMALKRCPNAWYVAWKVLNDRSVAETSFVFGLSVADASSIRDWIEFAKPRVGLRRVLKHLRRRGAEQPEVIGWAGYWFPLVLSEEERDIAESYLTA